MPPLVWSVLREWIYEAVQIAAMSCNRTNRKEQTMQTPNQIEKKINQVRELINDLDETPVSSDLEEYVAHATAELRMELAALLLEWEVAKVMPGAAMVAA